MTDQLDILLHKTLSRKPQPELPKPFAKQVTARLRKPAYVRPAAQVLLIAYWTIFAFFVVNAGSRISWPLWLVAALSLLVPLVISLGS
jgi:hypothetical protein